MIELAISLPLFIVLLCIPLEIGVIFIEAQRISTLNQIMTDRVFRDCAEMGEQTEAEACVDEIMGEVLIGQPYRATVCLNERRTDPDGTNPVLRTVVRERNGGDAASFFKNNPAYFQQYLMMPDGQRSSPTAETPVVTGEIFWEHRAVTPIYYLIRGALPGAHHDVVTL